MTGMLTRKDEMRLKRAAEHVRKYREEHPKEAAERAAESRMRNPYMRRRLANMERERREKGDTEGYKTYLLSQHWQQTRMERLCMDGFRCQSCGATSNLNVHHLTYRNLGHEDVKNDLITLCYDCHKRIHETIASGDVST